MLLTWCSLKRNSESEELKILLWRCWNSQSRTFLLLAIQTSCVTVKMVPFSFFFFVCVFIFWSVLVTVVFCLEVKCFSTNLSLEKENIFCWKERDSLWIHNQLSLFFTFSRILVYFWLSLWEILIIFCLCQNFKWLKSLNKITIL